jgi:D-lactate dehydrogenase (cytochrome)
VGTAESISFPTSEVEVIAIVKAMAAAGCPLTTQGARTGLAAGAVPQGGHVLNLSRMQHIGPCAHDADTGGGHLVVQPGALLTAIRAAIAPDKLFFPPDPTETSASIGGMVANNASGALTFCYGPTRHWVEALRVVLADGSVVALRRGEHVAQGRAFSLRTEDGREIVGRLPTYQLPAVKCAAGYYVQDDMDLIDLFIGMEGTLGIITEIELRLIPLPAAVIGLTTFLPSEAAALQYVRLLRGETLAGMAGLVTRPVAIEFFNHDTLDLLRRAKAENSAFAQMPALQPHFHTAVYSEFHGDATEALEGAVMEGMELALALGGNEDDTWYADTPRILESQKTFRHATPEAVNLLIDMRKKTIPELTKLGTDMSAPDAALDTMMALYRDGLQAAGLESVIFGQIGNNHVHVNILPRSLEEYARGKALYLDWARRIVELGGSVSAEHGIGKLKVAFLQLMFGEEAIAEMRALKACFDPAGLLNPGNLF